MTSPLCDYLKEQTNEQVITEQPSKKRIVNETQDALHSFSQDSRKRRRKRHKKKKQ